MFINMVFFTNVVDLQAASSACSTVRDWKILTETVEIPENIKPLAFERLAELTVQEVEVSCNILLDLFFNPLFLNREGAIAEYPAQLVVLDSSAIVVPQWNGSLRKRKINCCYRGLQSRSGGHRYYIGIIKYCYHGPQSRSGGHRNYIRII